MGSRGTHFARCVWLLTALTVGGLGATWADEPPPQGDLAAAEAELAAGHGAEAAARFRALLEQAVAAGADAATLAPLRRGLARALLLEGESYAALEPLEALAHGGQGADLALYAEGLLQHVRRNLEDGATAGGKVAPYLEDARRALAGIPEGEAVALGRAWLEGEVAYLGGHLADAVERWKAAPSANADDPQERWYRERLAHALYQLGRPKEAAEVYEALGNARAAASAWAAAREGEKALAHYEALLAATPGDETLLEDAMSAARFTSTQQRLEAMLSKGATDDVAVWVSWNIALSRLAQQRGDHGRSRDVLRQVVRSGRVQGSPLARVSYELAACLLLDPQGGESARKEAARVLIRGWEAEPGNTGLATLMGMMAEQDFRAAPRLWPDRGPLERSLDLQRVLEASLPDDPFVQANLGNIARLAGDSALAVAALTTAVELLPGDAATKNDLGLALLSAGHTEKAVAAFRAALADDPGFLAARQNLARLKRPYAGEAGVEARQLLLGAEDAARRAGQPSLLYRALALRAWRCGRAAEAR